MSEDNRKIILDFFTFKHLPEHLQTISKPCSDLAFKMATTLSDSGHPEEVVAGLRHLLEAKDSFVRAALDAR